MAWFGEPWPSERLRAPVCEDDRERIPVPVGASCTWCDVLIEEDDRGESIGTFDAEMHPAVGYQHRECGLRVVVGGPGHLQGRCRCCGGTEDPDLDMSPRDAALWVWEWVQRHGV